MEFFLQTDYPDILSHHNFHGGAAPSHKPVLNTQIPKEEDWHKFEVLTNDKGNKIIVCNVPKAKLQYTRRIENPIPETFFNSEFVTALSFYLAYLTAVPLTNNGQLQQVMFQSYQFFLAKAKAMSANESEDKDEDDRDYTDYRN